MKRRSQVLERWIWAKRLLMHKEMRLRFDVMINFSIRKAFALSIKITRYELQFELLVYINKKLMASEPRIVQLTQSFQH